MQEVRHDGLGQRAVGLEELGADIEEEDLLVVRVALDDGVGGFVLLAELVVLVGAAREDAEDQDLGVGALLLELREDRLDAFGGLFGAALVDSVIDFLLRTALVAGVVRADHEHDGLRLQAVEVAVVEAPEDVLGAVAADAEVGGLEGRPGLVPHGLAFAFPSMGDGVAQEDELGFAFLRDDVEGLMALLRAGMQDRLDGVVRGVGGEHRGGQSGGEQEGTERVLHGVEGPVNLPTTLAQASPHRSLWVAVCRPRTTK